jgi:hypothetical protein
MGYKIGEMGRREMGRQEYQIGETGDGYQIRETGVSDRGDRGIR